MIQDLRFALRMISVHRWFAAAVVATLALGIGLNTMIFTLVNAVLFKPIAVQGGERLVVVTHRRPSSRNDNDREGVSYPDFREYRAQSTSFEALAAYSGSRGTLSEQGNPPQRFNMGLVSAGMFEMLHVQPILGRGFAASDDQAGAEPVLMLGYGVWKDRYGSSPSVIGHSLRVNSKPATIIGVMPEGFKFPESQEMWMPIVPTPDIEKRSDRNYELYGILKPGVTIPRASADIETNVRRMSATYPDTNKDLKASVETFHDRFNGGQIRIVFLLMQGAVAFVLLIACANVANMMLSRAMERRREISIRAAMGASRWQIIRQLLIESTLLSGLGGLLGLALSFWGVHWFNLQTQDVGKPYWIVFEMDYTVFAVLALLCIGSGIVFGLAPALRVSRVDLNSTLKEGTRSLGVDRGGKLSAVLVVFQFAATLVLLTGAAMFVRGMLEQQAVNPAIPADQLLTGRLVLLKANYADTDARRRFYDELFPRILAIPGVTQVAITSNPPGLGAGEQHIEIDGQPLADPKQGPTAVYLLASPGYFATIDLPLISGRTFTNTDGVTGQRSAVVSRALAERFRPHQDAIGKRLRVVGGEDGGNPDDKPQEWMTVVGVSANFVQRPDKIGLESVVFAPYRQEGYEGMSLLVRSSGLASIGSASVTTAVRSAIQSIDQDLPLSQVGTLTAAVAHQQWALRVFGTLFSTFGLIALMIASVGIYAVIAQATTRRTQEIGVRMALGATSGNILTLILSRGAVQLAAGLGLGLATAFPAARLLKGLPLGVSATDPVVFASVSVLLTVVGLFACWLPARRAAALEPVVALRDE